MEQVDQVVRRRLEQALNGVFRRLLQTSERVAVAAESQANIQRNENLLRGRFGGPRAATKSCAPGARGGCSFLHGF